MTNPYIMGLMHNNQTILENNKRLRRKHTRSYFNRENAFDSAKFGNATLRKLKMCETKSKMADDKRKRKELRFLIWTMALGVALSFIIMTYLNYI